MCQQEQSITLEAYVYQSPRGVWDVSRLITHTNELVLYQSPRGVWDVSMAELDYCKSMGYQSPRGVWDVSISASAFAIFAISVSIPERGVGCVEKQWKRNKKQ